MLPLPRFSPAFSLAAVLLVGALQPAAGDVPKLTDAQQPLSAAESAKQFKVPDGFRLDLVACEPLIHEPSGVCWDALGRMFVCELHGYNIEGQFDIEELNKTGELDRVVRRIDANAEAKQKAKSATYGTVKLLSDSDGDGLMDRQQTWADRLPPCYGICPARDGIVVACGLISFFWPTATATAGPTSAKRCSPGLPSGRSSGVSIARSRASTTGSISAAVTAAARSRAPI